MQDAAQITKNMTTTGKNDYNTPPEIVEYWRQRLRIKQFFDPCPNNPPFDGLQIPWARYNWVNPPYGKSRPGQPGQDDFIRKGAAEARNGCTSVFIIPCTKVDGEIFKTTIWPEAADLIFITGRVAFIDPATGQRTHGNPRGSMFVVFERHASGRPRVDLVDIEDFKPFVNATSCLAPHQDLAGGIMHGQQQQLATWKTGYFKTGRR